MALNLTPGHIIEAAASATLLVVALALRARRSIRASALGVAVGLFAMQWPRTLLTGDDTLIVPALWLAAAGALLAAGSLVVLLARAYGHPRAWALVVGALALALRTADLLARLPARAEQTDAAFIPLAAWFLSSSLLDAAAIAAVAWTASAGRRDAGAWALSIGVAMLAANPVAPNLAQASALRLGTMALVVAVIAATLNVGDPRATRHRALVALAIMLVGILLFDFGGLLESGNISGWTGMGLGAIGAAALVAGRGRQSRIATGPSRD